ncbi:MULTISPECIES: hypothetical protein [Nostoc]|uniref:Uncharacterized protein n=1 Tax=Nostoc paludosum FACHB-159 TaxID=2692908 RepID=A0ABR8K6U3_9NOSO|nr:MULTISPECIES: hypothetical protein [Nostoc]MBD2735214.1 hypothetical protein [Nostoc paludosum FACHB-159]
MGGVGGVGGWGRNLSSHTPLSPHTPHTFHLCVRNSGGRGDAENNQCPMPHAPCPTTY